MVATPDGQYLLGLDYGGVVELWETDLWGSQVRFQAGVGGEEQLALHPTGQFVAVRREQGVSIFTLGEAIASHYDTDLGGVASLGFCGGGSRLGVGCEDGRVVLLESDLDYQQDTYHMDE